MVPRPSVVTCLDPPSNAPESSLSKARTALKVVGGLAVVLGIGIAGTIGWAGSAAEARLSRTYETHRVDIPVPWPLTADEIDALRAARLAEIPAPPSDPSVCVRPATPYRLTPISAMFA
jgi:hypothetical protein